MFCQFFTGSEVPTDYAKVPTEVVLGPAKVIWGKITILQSLKGSCTMIIGHFYRLRWLASAKKCIVGFQFGL
jgi:hypothetical protein